MTRSTTGYFWEDFISSHVSGLIYTVISKFENQGQNYKHKNISIISEITSLQNCWKSQREFNSVLVYKHLCEF